MIKKLFLLCLAFFGSSSAFFLHALDSNEQKLILNMENTRELPRNYRKANSPFLSEVEFEIPFIPSREGLDELRISGSSQFSKKGLEAIIKDIDEKNIYIIDLRQESHGFINNHAASWYGLRDWGNVGKTPAQIEHDQKARLIQLKQEGKALVYKDKYQPEPFEMPVKKINTEHKLVKEKKLKYKRFYVTDHTRPSDETVNEFISFVKQLPKNTWLHFHCAAGKGRTTTFMIMYDIIHNAHTVDFEDILIRHWLIGGQKLDKEFEEEWREECSEERLEFLREFYQFVQNDPKLMGKWSTKKTKDQI